MSTPAASHLIRIRNATGGILLTASHNPGGPNEDFGIKYNLANGAPAPESVTNKMFENSKTITSYKIADIPDVDLSTIGTKTYGPLEVEIVDSTKDYVEMLKDIFDFDLIKKFLAEHKDFKVLFDGLNGVTGDYGVQVFEKELGIKGSTQNCVPQPGLLEAVLVRLEEEGVVVDERKPDVIRVAPAPLYNTFEDVEAFVQIFGKACLDAAANGKKDGHSIMAEGGRDDKGWSEIK